MNRKWFWLTLVFLFIFTSSVISWAVIFSPIRFQPKIIEKFETQVNGLSQKNEVWVNQGSLEKLIPIITEKLAGDGWAVLGKSINLAPEFFGILDEESALDPKLQMKVFKKGKIYKTVGLWEASDENQTYGYVSEIPDASFSPIQARTQWKFPLKPPDDADELFCQKLENFQIALISLPMVKNPDNTLSQLCASQGFNRKLLRRESDKKTYLLSKSNTRIVAILSFEENQNYLSMVSLNN